MTCIKGNWATGLIKNTPMMSILKYMVIISVIIIFALIALVVYYANTVSGA